MLGDRGFRAKRIGEPYVHHTTQTRGMIAKVAHLVRIICEETDLDCFVRLVHAEYHELITTRIGRGEVLWAQFEDAVAACRADPKGDDRGITEKVNEMAVAKVFSKPFGYAANMQPPLMTRCATALPRASLRNTATREMRPTPFGRSPGKTDGIAKVSARSDFSCIDLPQ